MAWQPTPVFLPGGSLWTERPGGPMGLQRIGHDWATKHRLVIAFLPRSNCLLISWLQSPSAVILEPKKIKSVSVSIVSPSICHEVMEPDAMTFSSAQFSSVTQSCLTLCDPMNCSMPGLPVHHQLPEFTQTHAHWVSDAIQPSYPLSSPPPPAPSPSQHQGLFQWVNSSHEVAKVLEFQLQHQSFQWTSRTDLL